MDYFLKIYNTTSVICNPNYFCIHPNTCDLLTTCLTMTSKYRMGLILSSDTWRNCFSAQHHSHPSSAMQSSGELHFPEFPPFQVGVCLKGIWGKFGRQKEKGPYYSPEVVTARCFTDVRVTEASQQALGNTPLQVETSSVHFYLRSSCSELRSSALPTIM